MSDVEKLKSEIQQCRTTEDIVKCREVMLELRPHVAADSFVATVQEMLTEGYQLIFIEREGKAVAAAGYRYLQYLYNGKHLYIDDLVTHSAHRGHGYGGVLLDFVADEAKRRGFEVVTLDSGHQRHTAHRLYLNKGFTIVAHHFSRKLV